MKTIYGKIPERPNGSDCKSDVYDFGGSNPPLPTTNKAMTFVIALFVCVAEVDRRTTPWFVPPHVLSVA